MLLALSAPAAQAAATRAEFVAQAEPLCAATNQLLNKKAKKTDKALKKAAPKKGQHQSKKQEKASTIRFFHILGAFDVTIGKQLTGLSGQLAAIPPPAADAAAAAQWTQALAADAQAFTELGTKFKSRSLKKIITAAIAAEGLDKQLKATDAIVAGWGFQECLVAPGQGAPSL